MARLARWSDMMLNSGYSFSTGSPVAIECSTSGRVAALTLLLLVGTVGVAYAADVDSVALLSRVQSKVRETERTGSRYVCRQQIDRRSFETTGHSVTIQACGTLDGSETRRINAMRLMVSDRARLDVMLASGLELFSWPGAHRFETATPDDLLGGGFGGRGDFASFLIDIFTLNKVRFEYEGACEGPYCVRFKYEVPLEVSRYVLKSELGNATVAYHGTFDVNLESAELMQMTVVVTDPQRAFSMTCDVRARIMYAPVRTAAGEFMIPQSTEHEYLSKDGSYSVNRVSYEECQQYQAESVISFSDSPVRTTVVSPKASPALPLAGSELWLRLKSKIDSEQNFEGDQLEATLDRSVRDNKAGRIQAGTVFRGHLAELKKVYYPTRQVVIAIRFDAMFVNGEVVPLTLEPIGKVDQRGREIFGFSGLKLVLGRDFISHWRARSN